MWDLLFVLSFIINVALLVHFLKLFDKFKKPLKKSFDKKKDEVVGYYHDDKGPVSLKQADSFDYKSVFDNNAWRRNQIGM